VNAGVALRPGWIEALRDWRARRVADPDFRRWALNFWPTRRLARRRAAELFDLTTGFVHAQALAAWVELDLSRLLAPGPASLANLAQATGLPAGGMAALLEAAAALGLARRAGERFGLGELGAALLDNPGAVAMIRHHRLLYADLADPVAMLARGGGGALARLWSYDGGSAEAVADYSALMAASQPMVAEEILAACDLGPARVLLDIGGGEGAFLEAALRAHPHLRGILFDLAPVAARAAARLERAGFAARVTVAGGDMRADPLPPGADTASLVRVVHDHDDAPAAAILAAAQAALPAGGRLIVAEPMAETPGFPRVGAYFSLYLRAMGSGRPRSAKDLAAMLRAAGFLQVRERPSRQPMLVRVLEARKS
jgi:demethylspheroidene O-methyltransferase